MLSSTDVTVELALTCTETGTVPCTDSPLAGDTTAMEIWSLCAEEEAPMPPAHPAQKTATAASEVNSKILEEQEED
jgi:hypothetical protein